MKRILSIVLIILVLFTFCFNSLMVTAANSGTIGECTWKLEGTVLIISGNGSTGNVPKRPWPTTITKVIVEEGVTELGIQAFYQCSSLTEVVLPNSLKTIASSCFGWCGSLRSLYIPKNVSYIDEWALQYCTGLQKIDVDASNAHYTSQDGVLFNKSKTIIVRYPPAKSGSFYEIPSTVTEIANNAFEDCSYLNGFFAPNNISRIGYNAFSYCGYSNNKSNYENGILYLGPYAISADWDKTVTNCVLKEGTKLIAHGCFASWDEMKTLVIPDGLTTIGDSALAFCSSLESIRLPKSLKYIGEGAFSDSKALINVYYAGDINTKNNIIFGAYNSCVQNQAFWHYGACQGIGLHDWKTNSRTDSTCANEGKEYKSCNKCGENTTVIIEKKQHNFDKWQITKEPTCAVSGLQERRCTQCGYNEKESIKKLDNHNFSDWTDEKAATCTEQGTQKRTCLICNNTETKNIDALGHDVEKYTSKTDGSAEFIVLEGTCKRCGQTITKNVSSNIEDNESTNVQDKSTGASIPWKLVVCVAGSAITVLAVVITIIVILKRKKNKQIN